MKMSVSSRREAHFCLSAGAQNASEMLPELKKNPFTMERKIDMLFRSVFFSDSEAILDSRIYQNRKKKLLGSTPRAFLKPSWCPETFLKRLGIDFESLGALF